MATALIQAFSGKIPLLALKISPHIHDSLGNSQLRAESSGIKIYEDLGPHHKNSGRFLEAGALQSFFMETDDRHLAAAFDMFMKECNPSDHPVICESGALGSLIRPGVLIFILRHTDTQHEHKLKLMRAADLVLPAKIFSTRDVLNMIGLSGNSWHLCTV